jgi:ParB family chromosome partitioning protein
MAQPQKSRLGRGLGALLAEGAPAAKAPALAPAEQPNASTQESRSVPAGARLAANGDLELPVNLIEPNPNQPRKEFDPERLRELADSIRSEGLLQPVLVRPHKGKYQLIAGERRWRAFQLLQLKYIPARISQAESAAAATAALIENLQRENLNPIEEAAGFASLMEDFDLKQDEVAERVGKARASVANALRLLSLPKDVQGYLTRGMLSVGHAKLLLTPELTDADRTLAARRMIEEGLSVRASEKLVQSLRKPGSKPAVVKGRQNQPEMERIAIADIERRIGTHLQTRVALKHRPRRGSIVIEYLGNHDLQRILEKLGIQT